MASDNSTMILFSSNSTVKYVRDIFNVLAMPENAEYQFRYQTKYVDSDARDSFRRGCKGSRALVCFRSRHDCAAGEEFCIPIRWVIINEVKPVSDVYVVKFTSQSYPSFSNDYDKICHDIDLLRNNAQGYFNRMSNNAFAVINGVLPAVRAENTGRDDNWQKIVNVISLLPEYKSSYLLKFSSLLNAEESSCERVSGRTKLIEGKMSYINIDYYQNIHDSDKKSKIEVSCDPNAINVTAGFGTDLQSRYDSLRIGFQAKKVMANTVSEITIRTIEESGNPLQTELVIPVKIERNRREKIVKASFTALGAFLVGLPALIGDDVILPIKVLISLAGVIVLGANSYFESREK